MSEMVNLDASWRYAFRMAVIVVGIQNARDPLLERAS